ARTSLLRRRWRSPRRCRGRRAGRPRSPCRAGRGRRLAPDRDAEQESTERSTEGIAPQARNTVRGTDVPSTSPSLLQDRGAARRFRGPWSVVPARAVRRGAGGGLGCLPDGARADGWTGAGARRRRTGGPRGRGLVAPRSGCGGRRFGVGGGRWHGGRAGGPRPAGRRARGRGGGL